MKEAWKVLVMVMFIAGCARTPMGAVISNVPEPAAPKSIGSKDAQAEFNKGIKAYKSEQYTNAQEHFEKVTKIDPTIPEAHLDLALALYQQGKADQAKRHMDEAASLLEKQHSDMGSSGSAGSPGSSSSDSSGSGSSAGSPETQPAPDAQPY